MKKVLIHQPYKYGDFINLIPMAKKLKNLGYNVVFPHSRHTQDLVEYLDGIETFEIGPTDISTSKKYCLENSAILVDCQFSDNYNSLCTVHGGNLFIEEIKYYVAEDILKCGLKYEEKYNLVWNRNYEREEKLKKILKINDNENYSISHLVGDNGRFGKIPDEFASTRIIEVTRMNGFSLFDWFPIIINAENIFTIQSSVQCFVDCIKKQLKHKNFFLLNDSVEKDRLLVPAYDWNMSYFVNKRLR